MTNEAFNSSKLQIEIKRGYHTYIPTVFVLCQINSVEQKQSFEVLTENPMI